MAHLHRAARLGNYQEVAAALADGVDVNAFSVQKFTPLMLASREGFADIVRLLLKAKADPNLAHPNGRTPIQFAACNGLLEVVGILCSAGADLNAGGKNGFTPLIGAAMFGHTEVVDLLKKAGADSSLRDGEGMTVDDWLAIGGVRGKLEKLNRDHRWFNPGPDGLTPADKQSDEAMRRMMAEGLSAEEWAAKHGRFVYFFSFGSERFEDPEVQEFAHRVSKILLTKGLLAEFEEKFLIGDDLADARKHRAKLDRWQARRKKREEQKQARTKALTRGPSQQGST